MLDNLTSKEKWSCLFPKPISSVFLFIYLSIYLLYNVFSNMSHDYKLGSDKFVKCTFLDQPAMLQSSIKFIIWLELTYMYKLIHDSLKHSREIYLNNSF